MLALDTKELLKGCIKTVVAAITSVMIVNLVDSAYPLYSKEWFRHLWFATITTILIFEGRYWYNWAVNGKSTVKQIVEDTKNETKNP